MKKAVERIKHLSSSNPSNDKDEKKKIKNLESKNQNMVQVQ